MKRWLGVLALVWIVPVTGAAQDTTQVRRPDTTAALQPAGPITLSLADALAQARRNSPTYRQVLNNESPAKWGVRNAYGNLLPSVSASADMGYTGEGESNFGGGFVRPTSAFLTSGYNVGVFWQLDGRAISAPGQAKAIKHATDEDISGAGIARGITWNRSVGTALGARATASAPSSVSMISRPPWNSCPKIAAPFACATSASRANPGMHRSSSAVSSCDV